MLLGFSPNQKFWGCACTPASYTSAYVWESTFSKKQVKSSRNRIALETLDDSFRHGTTNKGYWYWYTNKCQRSLDTDRDL